MKSKDYTIRSRWFDGTWHTEEKPVTGSFEDAGREAILMAQLMDKIHGDSHSWNVMLWDYPRGEHGAYYEWFHGRTD